MKSIYDNKETKVQIFVPEDDREGVYFEVHCDGMVVPMEFQAGSIEEGHTGMTDDVMLTIVKYRAERFIPVVGPNAALFLGQFVEGINQSLAAFAEFKKAGEI